MKLKDVSKLKNGKKANYSNIGNIPVYGANGIIGYTDKPNSPKNAIIIGRVGANAGSVFYSFKEHWVSDNAISVLPINDRVNPYYLYYALFKLDLNRLVEGSAQPLINQTILNSFDISIPDIVFQDKVVEKILILDKKISLNKHINDNLDALLTTIFEEKVKNSGFDEAKLTDIANYKNGLAMQKYRPKNNESSLPVLKIKELNQGYTDNSSDRCSTNIDKGVIVNQGDIIFSWSGTLLVKNWSGKTAGLNQHLFKVTSNQYPDWFIYEWTKHYLKKFQLIASGKATTLGHIKRNDLKSSKVFIPNKDTLNEYNTQLKPLYDKRIAIIKETQCLNDLKQTLLQKYF
ncbi:restriction endonuclease subunit S [Lactobacillus crispatus]